MYKQVAVEYFKGAHTAKSAGVRRSHEARRKIAEYIPFLDHLIAGADQEKGCKEEDSKYLSDLHAVLGDSQVEAGSAVVSHKQFYIASSVAWLCWC